MDRSVQPGEKPKFAYIDCVRGYAVLLVITCHLAYEFPELPYPVHRVASLGWHGVQLFFLASCVTLLMSWHHEATRYGTADVRAFFIRRFLRIAPAYYAAAALYYWLTPPAAGFDGWQLATALTFTNAWHPALMPTVAGRWMVVPGGWSIGVEFTFYFLFPLIAVFVTSLRRALLFLAGTLVIGLLANIAAQTTLAGTVAAMQLNNFLYFWFPNQAAVFVLGSVLYFLIRHLASPNARAARAFVNAYGNALPLLAFATFAALTYVDLGHWLDFAPRVPAFLAASVLFAALILCLSAAPQSLFANRFVAAMGRVSFSAYLLHFAVLKLLPHRFPELFGVHLGGYRAIAAYAATWVVVVVVTFTLSWCTYRAVELPMMTLAKRLTRPSIAPTRWSPPATTEARAALVPINER